MASNIVFHQALEFTLKWEGGYSNHPNDRGGATNRGITQATYNQCRQSWNMPICDVKQITDSEVKRIYSTSYWVQAYCNEFDRLLAICHFDWSVNHGVHGAIQTLQHLISAVPDGIYGAKSREAYKKYRFTSSDAAMAIQYCNLRERWYRSHGTGSQEVFLKGWLNRLNALRRELGLVK